MKQIFSGLLSLFICSTAIGVGQHITVSRAITLGNETSPAITLWYETFGQKTHPAMLLIMGSGGQGMFWPTAFCEQLAGKGFYIIRYDHRDAGQSTRVDFKKHPYTLTALAQDGIDLLDALKISEAHVFGLSMGGPIGEIMSVNFPGRVLSLALMGSHYDYLPLRLAYEGEPTNASLLSAPRENYFTHVKKIWMQQAPTLEAKIKQKMEQWQLLNGSVNPFDEKSTRDMHRTCLEHASTPEQQHNYISAMRLSEDIVRTIHSTVSVPTVIFHGTEDPLLGSDHAYAIARDIKNSVTFIIHGMGHLPNSAFFSRLIDAIINNSQRTLS